VIVEVKNRKKKKKWRRRWRWRRDLMGFVMMWI
jgi:hypothetical protein